MSNSPRFLCYYVCKQASPFYLNSIDNVYDRDRIDCDLVIVDLHAARAYFGAESKEVPLYGKPALPVPAPIADVVPPAMSDSPPVGGGL